MITWISKPLGALSMLMLLGACEQMDAEGGLLASISPPEDAALPAVPLSQALMMRGNVTLVPPTGYCIDPETLSQSFALMARCDNMGASSGGAGAPAGVLTVSIARNSIAAALPNAQDFAKARGLGAPEQTKLRETSVIFKTTGPAPSPDLAPEHWRSVAQVGRFTMGAALYGPEGLRAVSSEGATVLEEMIKRTTEKTNAG